jgi:hypothetical protein
MIMVVFFGLWGVQVWAQTDVDYTHDAGLEFDLTSIQSKGKPDSIAKVSGSVRMNWETGACEFESKRIDLPCRLDRTRDLVNLSGDVVMSKIPRIVFDQKNTEKLLLALSAADKKQSIRIYHAIRENESALLQGFEVPWYSLQDDQASVAAGSPALWSGFGSLFVDFYVTAPQSLGMGSQIHLRATLKKIKPRRGVFDVTGSHSIGNY